jgi:hypothetical protein
MLLSVVSADGYEPRMHQPGENDRPPVERRRHKRVSVMLAATLERAGRETRVRLVNLSAEGSSLVGVLPDKHCSVTFRRNGMAIRSRIAWASDGKGGIAFDEPLDLARLLVPVAGPQVRYDLPCRRPGLSPRPPTIAERRSLERCIEILGVAVPPRNG